MASRKKGSAGLSRYLSPLGAWALAFGCAVGWGAFVMPGTTFLPIAGPLGTALGLALGCLLMLVIGVNYHYMMNRFPDAGGAFTYAKEEYGYDHGFLSAWFLLLVYVAIIWANATALPLVFRNLLGGMFQFGFHYTVAGYEVYLGEILLTAGALAVVCAACIRGGRFAVGVQIVFAFVLLGGILLAGGAAFLEQGGSFTPAFLPGQPRLPQVLHMVALAPWAFVGFESISHSAGEFRFSVKKSLTIMTLAVLAGAIAYITLAVLAVSVLPEGYGDWLDYIADLGNLSGLDALPTFHAVSHVLGPTGLVLLGVTLCGGVVTGMVGNSIAASRLLYAMALDGLLPRWFSKLNRSHTPKNALLFILLISLPIPFFGRVATGWIVDVGTIGATIAYAYASFTAYKCARHEGNTLVQITGMTGIVSSILFFLYFLVPNFWSVSALATESYMILIAWSVIGFVYFRHLLTRDEERRFGQSTAVWIVILFMIFFTSTLWVRNAAQDTAQEVVAKVSEYNSQQLVRHGIQLKLSEMLDTNAYLQGQLDRVGDSLMKNSTVQLGLVFLTMYIMFDIYNLMKKREQEMEIRKVEAEQSSRAKSTFLSNMSHDIRTPMNAIIGYVTLSKKEAGIPPKVSGYLTKIEASSGHLLSLINDVLEVSRIESGKMELEPDRTDLVKTMGEVRDLFATQMEGKRLTYTVDASGVTHKMVLCDASRLNRVLLNLISNAYKFTPEGGSVTVTLSELGDDGAASANPGGTASGGGSNTEDGAFGTYELRVRDSGMGMSPEFAEHVFEAYERERRASSIQGTGLGMAISKSIVDLMGGDISVETEQGVGTEFIIRVQFPLLEESETDTASDTAGTERDFTGVRLLLAEDNDINREIATLLLEEAGFVLDTAENGRIAVEKVAASKPGDYQCVLMDIQMPVMDGYEAARAIRKLKDKKLAKIPIVAMTANAFSEDIQAAKDAGMNSHIAKPLDVAKMMETLSEVLYNTISTPPPPPRGRRNK